MEPGNVPLGALQESLDRSFPGSNVAKNLRVRHELGICLQGGHGSQNEGRGGDLAEINPPEGALDEGEERRPLRLGNRVGGDVVLINLERNEKKKKSVQ